MINVVVNGAAGKMGLETVKAVQKEKDIKLVGICDVKNIEVYTGGLKTSKDLKALIADTQANVVVDFTHPDTVMNNIKTILTSKAHAVVGTTGLSDKDMKEIEKLCKENNVNCLVAPNFAVGAVLMMMFSQKAAKHMPNVEIIEMHHDKKADAPSGTAIKTADLIQKAQAISKSGTKETETIKGARGGNKDNIHIHSVRLPGLVAHQEVIFGGLGQTLTIRHDSLNRESFMPGVIMAIRKMSELKGLVYGLENIL